MTELFVNFEDDTLRRAMKEALRTGFAGNTKALEEARRQGYIRFSGQFSVWNLTTRGRNFLNPEPETRDE